MVGISLLVAVAIVFASLSSVIGQNEVMSSIASEKATSPLFRTRTCRMVDDESEHPIQTSYLGQGKLLNILFGKALTFRSALQRGINLIQKRPNLLSILEEKIESDPEILAMLAEHDVGISDVKNHFNAIKTDPSILEDDFKDVEINVPLGGPILPTGLNDTNVIAALIVVIALIPLFLVLAILIATITIITCFNLGGCFENLWTNLVGGFIQGLKQPDSLI